MHEVRSAAAVFRTDCDGVIAEWNDAAAVLTGIPAAAVVGRNCWDVIRGRDAAGELVCRRDCRVHRLARLGRAAECGDLRLPTPSGLMSLALSTIVVRNDDDVIVLHTMRESEQPPRRPTPVALTPRQREVLHLVADGLRVKEIAQRLTVSQATVRNHIHAILVELNAHSQLEAVATARRLSLLDGPAAA